MQYLFIAFIQLPYSYTLPLCTPPERLLAMSHDPNRWAFIVPGDGAVLNCQALMKLLNDYDKTWREFCHVSLRELLQGISDAGAEKLLRESECMIETTLLEPVIVDVMEELDILIENEDEHAFQYHAIRDGIVALFHLVCVFIPQIMENPRFDHGEPIEITLDRVLGHDLIFTVHYQPTQGTPA